MTDREPKIGDVIENVSTGQRLPIEASGHLIMARAWVKSGRWVIVDRKPQEEQQK